VSTILTKTASTGQRIEVGLNDRRSLWVKMDGNQVTGHGLLMPLSSPRNGATHYISIGKAGVGFTAEEAATIEQAQAAAEEAYEQQPERIAQRLRNRREQLALAVLGAEDEAAAAFNRAWDRGDEGGAFRSRSEWEKTASERREALSAFDAEHPEVIATIRAEKDAAARRFAETN
jgi:hypothetical protein